jgi:hypothetical protein
MTTETRRHLSLLRSYMVADAFTIGNAASGTIAIFLCLDYFEGTPIMTSILIVFLLGVAVFSDGLTIASGSARSGSGRPCSIRSRSSTASAAAP